MKREKQPLPEPVPTGAVDLSRPRAASMTYQDLVAETNLDDEGAAKLFVGKDGEWGKFQNARDILGVTVLAASDPEGNNWVPMIGARVAFFVQGVAKPVVDMLTAGDGRTSPLPLRHASQETCFGPVYHLPILPGVQFRVELYAPGAGYGGVRVRVGLACTVATEGAL